MEVFVIVLLAAGVGAALYWDQYTQRAYVTRQRAEWADRALVVPPVGTISYGDYPPRYHTRRVYGALALVDDRLIFAGHRDALHDCAVPVASLRWIGLRARYKNTWNRRIATPELRIHAETPSGWRVYTFAEGALRPFAEQVAQHAGLTLHDLDEKFEDFGPEAAVHLIQDALGNWQRITPETFDPAAPPPDWDGLRYMLYLAPDHLVYDWRHTIPLDTIRRVDMHAAGKLNPFAENLLKIEYVAAEGDPRGTGFLLANAGDWAGIIEQRISVPVIYHAGRQAADSTPPPHLLPHD
jgi:hypothetical protein